LQENERRSIALAAKTLQDADGAAVATAPVNSTGLAGISTPCAGRWIPYARENVSAVSQKIPCPAMAGNLPQILEHAVPT
jgi:hypothetical protein